MMSHLKKRQAEVKRNNNMPHGCTTKNLKNDGKSAKIEVMDEAQTDRLESYINAKVKSIYVK